MASLRDRLLETGVVNYVTEQISGQSYTWFEGIDIQKAVNAIKEADNKTAKTILIDLFLEFSDANDCDCDCTEGLIR